MSMRKPPKGIVWLHVDRLDKADGLVWAVQYREADAKGRLGRGKAVYRCAQSVIFRAAGFTQFHGPRGPQPKAVIVFPSAVVRWERTATFIEPLTDPARRV